MRIVVMCGGLGTRLNEYSLPKPMNYIHGRPAISYVLETIPFASIDFVVSPHLEKYQFESFIRMHTKNKLLTFHTLPYCTRGPVESAWLGTLSFNEEEPVIFLDNDVVYNFPSHIHFIEGAFLGYSIDTTGSEAYCFLNIQNQKVVDIQEKTRISNMYGCGVYGFSSIGQFRNYARSFMEIPQTRELYMSMLYSIMIKDNVTVRSIYFEKPFHIGSLYEVKNNLSLMSEKSLRVCFDLDHTLVTFPTKEKDYETVQPVKNMIAWVQKLKEKGHTIIIYTARRMQTHSHNIGAATKDCARTVLNTLDLFQIPYDELIFGKPIADIYVDDKALNPYMNTFESFGLFDANFLEKPINALTPNKYNQITVQENRIIKRGPSNILDGEIYYYQHIPIDSMIYSFFPSYHGCSIQNTISEITMEYIKGIPYAYLYKSELLTFQHIDEVLEKMNIIHNTYSSTKPSVYSVKMNYLKKLEQRMARTEFYPYDNVQAVKDYVFTYLQRYTDTLDEHSIVAFIHGDLWFSNILLNFKNEIKFIDMRGKCWEEYTTGGDPMYDYAKLYQSILGYDMILNNWPINTSYIKRLHTYYRKILVSKNISLEKVEIITFSLIIGTLPFIEEKEVRNRIWSWVVDLFLK